MLCPFIRLVIVVGVVTRTNNIVRDWLTPRCREGAAAGTLETEEIGRRHETRKVAETRRRETGFAWRARYARMLYTARAAPVLSRRMNELPMIRARCREPRAEMRERAAVAARARKPYGEALPRGARRERRVYDDAAPRRVPRGAIERARRCQARVRSARRCRDAQTVRERGLRDSATARVRTSAYDALADAQMREREPSSRVRARV